MKNLKNVTKLLVTVMMFASLLTGCTSTSISDEQGEKWASEHGYVKAEETSQEDQQQESDTVSTATEKKVGGVNYGPIEWDEDLQVAAIKEFLKGGTYIGDPSFAQDDSGYNYREMYQLATIHGDSVSNTNLEMILDASTLHLLGASEAGTGKVLDFENNPHVSISWVRQLHLEDEETYNYYGSYGVQYNGTVKIYTLADLDTTEGQDALINLCDKYYPTLASTWAAYGAGLANLTSEEEIRQAKLDYITNSLNRGTMVLYEIVPTSIVITAPFLMNMSPQMNNGATYTTVQDGTDKYNYSLGLQDSFIDQLVAYKAEYISSEQGLKEVEDYYSTDTFKQLDTYCQSYGLPTNLENATNVNNAAGLKTQTTYIPK